jgi:hypothetical protein
VGTALVGLVGVIVGALATGGFQWWATVRKERLDARTAMRILMVSAENVIGVIEVTIPLGAYLQTRPPDLLTDAAELWRDLRMTVARTSSHETFDQIAGAFRTLDPVLMRRAVDAAATDGGGEIATVRIDAERLEMLEDIRLRFIDALEAMRKVAT